MELLSPAGNLEKLKIAFRYGADAVYLAGEAFGLRSAADNLNLVELSEAVSYAAERGKRVYLTMNALLHNHELELLGEYLQELKKNPPHAVIASDLGVMEVVRRHLEVPIHLSTQASCLNSYYAEMIRDLGVKRVVVGRELSIEEAARLKEKTGLEVEVFGHGALCMSYSGHCTISNYTAGRDANRGGCIQNCRYKYDLTDQKGNHREAYFMSSKDLIALELLPRFLELGIDSLKIEGRMKSNLYIASTARAYRGAMDHLQGGQGPGLDYWKAELEKIPHRDYTQGNLEHPAGLDSVYDRQDDSTSPWEMAGNVLAVREGRFLFEAKNKLTAGTRIEFMPTSGEAISFPLLGMTDLEGEALEVLQPNQCAWMERVDGLEERMVARYERIK